MGEIPKSVPSLIENERIARIEKARVETSVLSKEIDFLQKIGETDDVRVLEGLKRGIRNTITIKQNKLAAGEESFSAEEIGNLRKLEGVVIEKIRNLKKEGKKKESKPKITQPVLVKKEIDLQWSNKKQIEIAGEIAKEKSDIHEVKRGETLGAIVKGMTGKLNWETEVNYQSAKLSKKPKTLSEANLIYPGQFVWIENERVIVADEEREAGEEVEKKVTEVKDVKEVALKKLEVEKGDVPEEFKEDPDTYKKVSKVLEKYESAGEGAAAYQELLRILEGLNKELTEEQLNYEVEINGEKKILGAALNIISNAATAATGISSKEEIATSLGGEKLGSAKVPKKSELKESSSVTLAPASVEVEVTEKKTDEKKEAKPAVSDVPLGEETTQKIQTTPQETVEPIVEAALSTVEEEKMGQQKTETEPLQAAVVTQAVKEDSGEATPIKKVLQTSTEVEPENPNAKLTKENVSGWLIRKENYRPNYSGAVEILLGAAKTLDKEVKGIGTSRENRGAELAVRIIFKDDTFERFTAKFDSRADVAGKEIAVKEAAAEIAKQMSES